MPCFILFIPLGFFGISSKLHKNNFNKQSTFGLVDYITNYLNCNYNSKIFPACEIYQKTAPASKTNVIKLRKSWTSQECGVQFFVIIFEILLDKWRKMCGLFANWN